MFCCHLYWSISLAIPSRGGFWRDEISDVLGSIFCRQGLELLIFSLLKMLFELTSFLFHFVCVCVFV